MLARRSAAPRGEPVGTSFSLMNRVYVSAMDDLTFEGRVAVVTGAGGGIGRLHALDLARRGARVVVNDIGSAVDGSGSSAQAAEAVVCEIVAAGGEAVADTHSV